jgi:two-component system, sensor histidine kinase
MATLHTAKRKTRFLPRLKVNAASIAVLITLSLFLTLIPLLMIQLQKSQLRQVASQSRVDSVLWITYQFEREHSRLRVALRNAIDNPTPGAGQDLALRYDILFSRFDLIKNSPSLAYLHNAKEYLAVLNTLEPFVKRADPVIAGLNSRPIQTETLKELLQQANMDEELLRDLTNFSTNTVSKEIDARNATIGTQSSYILVFAALQWLILSGGLIGFMLYVRRQRLHNLQLTKFTRRLHQASRRADTANQAKSVFLANMSHELRTPFQGLLGMLNLLSGTSLSHTQQDYTSTAISSAGHLLKVLNDIIDISTIETGALKLRTAPVNLRALVYEVEGMLAASAHEKKIDLQVRVSAHLPEWIEADSTRLSQILLNLLNNAIKFTDTGSVDLEATLRPSSRVGEPAGMQITVQDSGIGMDDKTLAGLFSRFHQADLSIQRRYGGSGLGLEISQNLARMMGGNVTAHSQVGTGSVFTLSLPLQPSTAPDQAPLNRTVRLQKLNILVVDDHPINVKYLSILLEQMGHATVCCENGAQSLVRLGQQAFDVVLMDLHMPQMDGFQATRAIRQLQGPAANTKIVIISADILNNTRQVALDAGANEFITKPLLANELRKVLERCVDCAEAAPASPHQPPYQPPLPSPHNYPANSAQPKELVNTQIYQDFVDLMPKATIDKQIRALFDNDDSDIKLIEAALNTGDVAEAKRLAHQLKGVCMLMGFTHLGNALAQTEQASSNGQAPSNAALLAALRQSLDSTHTALRALSGRAFEQAS